MICSSVISPRDWYVSCINKINGVITCKHWALSPMISAVMPTLGFEKPTNGPSDNCTLTINPGNMPTTLDSDTYVHTLKPLLTKKKDGFLDLRHRSSWRLQTGTSLFLIFQCYCYQTTTKKITLLINFVTLSTLVTKTQYHVNMTN